LNREFNEDFKNVLKTVIFRLQVGFTGYFVPDFFQKVFLAVQTLIPLFCLTVPNFVVFFQVVVWQFNKDSKNVLKTVIFPLQVGFTSYFVPGFFQTVVLAVPTLTPLFCLTVPTFLVFF